MGLQTLSIQDQILEIKQRIVESRHNYQLGIISGGDEIEHRIITLCREVENLSEGEIEAIRPQIVDMLMDMKSMNDEIEGQLSVIRQEIEQGRKSIDANLKYRKSNLANDN